MSEGKAHWTYTCPICKKTFPYSMFAGRGVMKCDDCKAQIVEMVKSTEGEEGKKKTCNNCNIGYCEFQKTGVESCGDWEA